MQIQVSIGLFVRKINEQGLEIWMQKRKEDGPLDGKWEFPGGKIEVGESSKQAVVREVQEEVGIDIENEPLKLFKIHPYEYKDREIVLHVFLVGGELQIPSEKGDWFSMDYSDGTSKIEDIIPAANIPVINELMTYLKGQAEHQVLDMLWM